MKLMFFCVLLSTALLAFSQPTSFQPYGIGGGGQMFSPKINPTNDNEFYVNGGENVMFRTTDFGKNYSQLRFQNYKPNYFSTHEFTNNPNIAYSICDDENLGYPVRTNDGGQTWTRLPGFDENQFVVWRMYANYDNPKQLIMNYWEEIVISNDGGLSFNPIKRCSNENLGIVIGGVFFEGSNIYVATNEGVFRSTDKGSTFSLWHTSGIPTGEVIYRFSAAKSAEKYRFLCITAPRDLVNNDIGPYIFADFTKGIYVMEDTSASWLPRSAGIDLSNDFILYTGMAHNDGNTMYLAGKDQSLNAPLILKSSNGGLDWSKVFNSNGNQNISTGWAGHQGHRDWNKALTVFGLAVAPNNSQKIVFGDNGFVHVSADGGNNWNQAYVNSLDQHPANNPTPTRKYYRSVGLEKINCWQIHWLDRDNLLACVGEVGLLRSSDSGKSWGMDYTGVAGKTIYRLVETSSGKLYGASSDVQGLYEATQPIDVYSPDPNGKIICSADKGVNWTSIHTFNHPVYWLAFDPNSQTTMYASVVHNVDGGIWVTTNLEEGDKSVWTKLPNPPRTEGHPSNIVVKSDGKVLCTFSSRRNSVGVMSNSSGVFLYDPKLKSWNDLSDARMQVWTKDIVIDPNDSLQNTWYVAVSDGWGSAAIGTGGLYKTVTAGKNWTNVTGGMLEKVTSLTFDPQHPTHAYLSTGSQGLWLSKNMDQLIPTFSEVPAYPFGHPVRMYFNPYDLDEMWVSSFGNGMKMGRLEAVNANDEMTAEQSNWSAVPNPFQNELLLCNSKLTGKTPITIQRLDGTMVAKMTSNEATIEIETAGWDDGIYVIRAGQDVIKVVKFSGK